MFKLDVDPNCSLESIVVLSESESASFTSIQDTNRIRCIEDNSNTLHYSQLTLHNSQSQSKLNDTNSSSFLAANVENECFNLEREIKNLRSQLEDYKQENLTLKEELTKMKLNKRKSSENESFIDLDTVVLADKIEHDLNTTNNLFTDEKNFKSSFEYLIKNIWSITAFSNNQKNIDKLKILRDDLLAKIERVGNILANLSSSNNNSNYNETNNKNSNNSLNVVTNELISFKEESFTLKEKALKQNEILKSLIKQIQDVEINKKSSIPTQSDYTETETRTINDINQTNNVDPKYFYYYDVNGYIAIDDSLALNEYLNNTNANNPNQNKSNEHTSNPETNNNNNSQLDQSNLNEVNSQTQVEPIIYKCPKCQTTVDSASVSYEMYQAHIDNCDLENNLVCMFCLSWFNKREQHQYLNHIDIHLRELALRI